MQDKLDLLERVEAGEVVLIQNVEKVLREEVATYYKGVADYKALTARESNVLNASWEPYTVPKGMQLGLIKAPSWSVGTKIFTGFLALAWVLEVVAVISVFFAGFHSALPIAGGFISLVLSSCFANYWISRCHSRHPEGFLYKQDRFARSLEDKYRSNQLVETQCYFSGPIPKVIYEKYKRDIKLFDQVYVGSMDRMLFYTEEVHVRPKGDPFLIGRIEKRFYLGGQWDLEKEFVILFSGKEAIIRPEDRRR